MVTPLILAVPYLMLRLIADFSSVPWWSLRVAEAAFAAQVIALSFAGSIPIPVIAIYAAIPLAWASVAFVREARRASGLACRRYSAIATGNGAAVTSLAVLAASVPLSGGAVPPLAANILQLCVLVAGCAYFLGFATPRWLRTMWREPELRSYLSRLSTLLLSQELDVVCDGLATGARDAMGCEAALIGLRVRPDRLNFCGSGAEIEVAEAQTVAGLAMRRRRAVVCFDPARAFPTDPVLSGESEAQ